MPLDPSLVSYALGLAQTKPSNSQVVEDLAVVLENREELFAYLFTHTKILDRHPDLQELIRTLSDAHGSQASSKRPTTLGSAQRTNLQRELEQVLSEVVEKQSVNSNTLKRAQELQCLFSSARNELNAPQLWIENQPASTNQNDAETP